MDFFLTRSQKEFDSSLALVKDFNAYLMNKEIKLHKKWNM